MHTEDEAKKLICPHVAVASVLAFQNGISVGNNYPNCFASDCAMWRWVPLSTKEPGWKEAMQTLTNERGMSNKDASAHLATTEGRREFNLPTKPYRGYCGLAGGTAFIST